MVVEAKGTSPGMSAAEGFRLGGDPAQGTPFVA
jgi:hypothetical protein